MIEVTFSFQGFFTKNKGISYELSYVIFVRKNLIACTFNTLIYVIQLQNWFCQKTLSLGYHVYSEFYRKCSFSQGPFQHIQLCRPHIE